MSGAPVLRLGIRVRRERAEEALAALLPLLAGGAEESEPSAGTVEYALFGRPGDLPRPDAVRALVGPDLIGLHVSAVPAGWERRWHEHLRPVEVTAGGRRLRVRPPAAPAAPVDLVIDPGDSFGIGGHPSTRLCLELLLELEPGGALCDWGAGSGVLALAAARLGWAPVTAVELDPGALAAIRANAGANRIALQVLALDLTSAAPPWADTVCANLARELHHSIVIKRAPERLIASGMLTGQADAVAAAYARHGLRQTRRRVLDGWAGLLLERA